MKYFILIFLLYPSLALAGERSFAPQSDETILMIGQDKDSIDQYVDATQFVPGGFMVYTSIRYLEGLAKEPMNWGAGINDPKYLSDKYPQTVLQIGLYMVDSLDETVQEKFDANLKVLCTWLKEIKKPVYLRIGYEFDLPENHYDPQQYQAAYKYIVQFLKKNAVKNVAFVWHSFGVIDPAKPIEDWYPGDQLVDWVGISYFEPNAESLKTIVQFAQTHKKPLMIAEATPFKIGTTSGEATEEWFKQLFTFVRKNNVQALCYINWDWEALPMFKGKGWGDCRVQANEDIQKLWMNEISQRRYINASEELFPKLFGKIPDKPKKKKN